ncbi:TonB-dependent siderophore receptor [Pseudomonas oryzihabitans]|uniref:Outer membrane receptor for ferric coprogen and ferric-rhodotorulic acid n=1 Tax=Pseudomonas oryzihabitans TaxID=47885 RepID=A0AAJ2BTW9_9PSED|nr:TonB-dependent siderophore receptor [Pseudomonas psychrotolerans]MDR6232868.1 outer membrane receptor for ferric coprogen and ferric-rhodotorulic acid [Pseudomonas psychrotolerans]MDR6358185.1 outer membrane receptor for ferric coprogen and ferric-rhodotorulic acid [Pseudomonas psychrotolerans]
MKNIFDNCTDIVKDQNTQVRQKRSVFPHTILALTLFGSNLVAAYAEPVKIEIPAQPLSSALAELGRQTGLDIVYSADTVKGIRSTAVSATVEPEHALSTLLQGSGITFHSENGAVTLIDSGQRPLELDVITISGKAPGSITEGTGSYTTYSSSSSTRLNLTPQETPQTVTVLTRQHLDDQHIENVTDALDATAGITVVRDGIGADSDSFWSRGFMIKNYEIDGVPTSSSLANYRLSSAIYDRIEVVRGATGLISGLGTPSATINLIRKRPTFNPQISLTAEAGSWNHYGSGFDVSGPLNESGNVRGRLVADYKQQHAWVDRFKEDDLVLYGITELDLNDSTLLTLGFNHQTNNVTSPLRSGFPLFYSNGQRTDFKRSDNNAPSWSYYDNQLNSVFASIEHQFDTGWNGKVEYSHTQYNYDSVLTYLNGSIDQQTGSGAYVLPVRFKSKPQEDSLDAYATGPFALFGREHELITGVTLSQLRELNTPDYGGWKYPGADYDGTIADIHVWDGSANKPVFTRQGESNAREYQYGAYVTARFHLTDDTSLILGNRVVDWKRNSDSSSDSGSKSKTRDRQSGVYIPYAGLVHALDDTWSLYASYTKIFNPQSSWVRDINNAPLDPEEGTSYETGLKASFYEGRLNASLAMFKTEQDNLAIWQSDTFSYTSEQGTTTKGVELELNGELAKGWQISGGYAYSVSTDENDKRIVTQVPRHSLKTFTTYRLPGLLEKLTIGGGFNWQSKTGSDLKTYTQDSYALVNLMARYDISKNLSASVNLNNVFDREYYAGASSYGVYGEPRNFITSLKYTY